MNFFNDHIFISTLIFLVFSIVLHYYGKYKFAIAALFLAALFIRYFVAHLDPFLHDWDEKFHALVARNMMEHPFTPMLRTAEVPLHDIDYTAWCCNSIWLHKQPLFLWQMALSMKIFGVSEYAARYPSVLMGAIMVPVLYRIAYLMTRDRMIAFAAALFMCLSQYQFDLISGHKGMDHNDVAFGFYVLLSIWAYTEYIDRKKAYWIVLIGVFVGCAILNKWLTGLLIYAGWGLNILATVRIKKEMRKEILHLLFSLFICLVLFLPWQLYIFHAFPQEAKYEFALNTSHLLTVVEGHKGDWWFYIGQFPMYFGEYIYWLLPLGLIVLIIHKHYNTPIKRAVIACFLFALLFFSFIAQTRISSYFFVVVPLGFIIIATIIVYPLSKIKYTPVITYVLICICGFLVFDINRLMDNHNPNDELRKAKMKNAQIYRTLREYLPKHVKIVLNLPRFSDVEMMFYHKDVIAYSGYPSLESMDILERNKVPVAAFNNHRDHYIPDYVRWYTYRYILHKDFGYIYHR